MLDLARRTGRTRKARPPRLLRLVALASVGLLAACGAVDGGFESDSGPRLVGDGPAYVTEAEALAAGQAFVVGADELASGGGYLIQPTTVPASTSGEEVAAVYVDVEEAGDYTLWARVFAPSLRSDAVYLGLNGDTRRVYPTTIGKYVWLEVERVSLDAGMHRISLGHGEPGLRIDLFAVVMDEAVSGGELERLVSRSKGGDPDDDGGSPEGVSLRGNPDFDPADLTGDAAVWYRGLLASIDRPNDDLNPLGMAAKDDLYTYGRTLHGYVQSIMVAFRLTGDLRLLDHVDVIVERMRRELRDEWRDTVDGTDGTRDGYVNWVFRYSDEPHLMGKDTHESNEMRTHAMLAAVAYALDLNRDLQSPSGRDYGAHADFWRGYLIEVFEAKWRERKDVPTGFPIMTVPHTHTYYAWTKWHHYMGLLTGDEAYSREARRMADVLWDELRTVETSSGTAYVWARSVLALGGAGDYLHPTTYARYVFGDIVEFYLEGFGPWASDRELARFARTFTEFIMDSNDIAGDGFSSDVGGGVARAGIPSDGTWERMTTNRYRISAYALIGAWDATGQIVRVTEAIGGDPGSAGGAMMAVGAFVDAWWSQNGAAVADVSAGR